MKIIHKPKEAQNIFLELKKSQSLGFVPTMGALHQGHFSLIKQSLKENDKTIVSIFVNPTQFNEQKDLNEYPSSLKEDLEELKNLKIDFVFIPNFEDIYPDNYDYEIIEKEFSKKLCGLNRPGHFNGVLTIVMKLLQISQATKAYFGEKDFQQLQLIKGLCLAFFIPTEIISCPTLRTIEGLALSSRNKKLSPEALEKAYAFAKILNKKDRLKNIKNEIETLGLKIDYIEDHNNRRFAAVHIDGVRLIDNVEL